MTVVKAVALCGSLRKASYNRGLIRAAVEICKESIELEGIEIEYLEVEPLPMLNTDLETPPSGFPAVVEAFRQKIRDSDCILFASPEYNYSIAAPLKNAIDWASRPPNAFAGKAAAIVSAGGGFGGALAQFHLRQVGVFLDLHFVNKPELHVNAFQPPLKFNENGDLIDQETYQRLKQVLLSLKNLSLRLQSN
ncbi:LOW QUALITY PROTEIN: NAD(P)H:quinone oxidoreductase-like [Benincasa hispida]|uniref:LOW QUALITY PROTEIN: NAD(P)H:quinone oxidoreductase-like n=1 Tax=Benincasa hispida TaxID=102211 RepID=UPI001901AE36|nr:LOW QUALITY PROTEIN: NAD(P)H:quinone oxidoreductase-like [Benincasa hispida]